MEKIFNIFLFVNNGLISELGYVAHCIDGSDATKLAFLQNNLKSDHKNSVRIQIQEITHEEYVSKQRLGSSILLFEEVFLKENASANPLMCVTPVCDGQIRYDFQSEIGPLNMEELDLQRLYLGKMPDYLQSYVSDDVFDMSALINDDYLKAIKLLFNERKYVSCAKLLLSMIDSIAFIEFGDGRDIFKKWLNTYVELSNVKISDDELWEFRNSLLHMSNLHSRAVIAKKVASLIMYVGSAEKYEPKNTERTKHFDLWAFIQEVNEGLGHWLKTYSLEPAKMEKFVERYDLTVSDARMAKVEF